MTPAGRVDEDARMIFVIRGLANVAHPITIFDYIRMPPLTPELEEWPWAVLMKTTDPEVSPPGAFHLAGLQIGGRLLSLSAVHLRTLEEWRPDQWDEAKASWDELVADIKRNEAS